MFYRTTVRSWPAMALAAVFLAGTSFVLFNDIAFEGAKITTGHVLTGLALLAATAAGHLIVKTFREHRYGNGCGMVMLTAAALAYVATMSGARNAEQAAYKAERIDGSNAERDRINKLRERAQGMLDAAMRDVAAKCKGGVGPHCKGATATRDVYQAAVKGHDADLLRLGSPQTANAGYKAAAEALSMMGFVGRSEPEIERALIVLLPWLAVLIAELGTIVFLSSALGHRKELIAEKATKPPIALPEIQQSKEINQFPANVIPISGKHPVVRALESAGRHLSNRELASVMRVSEGEASKRCREIPEQLDVFRRGHFQMVGLRSWKSKATG